MRRVFTVEERQREKRRAVVSGRVADKAHLTPAPARLPGGKALVYGLVDPRTNAVRYVGKTLNPRRRMETHLEKPCNARLAVWLGELKFLGLRPEMVAIEIVPRSHWERAERKWIAHYRTLCDTLNVQPGGRVKYRGGQWVWKPGRGQSKRDRTVARFKPAAAETDAHLHGAVRVWTPEEIAAREAEVKSNSKRVRFTAIRGEGTSL